MVARLRLILLANRLPRGPRWRVVAIPNVRSFRKLRAGHLEGCLFANCQGTLPRRRRQGENFVRANLMLLGPLGFSLRMGPVFDRITIPVAGVVPTYDGEIQIRQNRTS